MGKFIDGEWKILNIPKKIFKKNECSLDGGMMHRQCQCRKKCERKNKIKIKNVFHGYMCEISIKKKGEKMYSTVVCEIVEYNNVSNK